MRVASVVAFAVIPMALTFAMEARGAPEPATSLVCDGVHETRDIEVTPVVAGNGGVGTAISEGDVIRTPRRVQVYIAGGAVQVHPDPGMLPRMVRKPSNGWFPVYDLVLGKLEITGRFALNALNKPNLNIDRRTGAIQVTGTTYFYGVCRKTAAPNGQVLF